MRKYSQSFLVYLIFGGLILIFGINFGPGSMNCGNGVGDYAATVNGDPIRREEWMSSYSGAVDRMRRQFGGAGAELTAEMMERFGLKQQVIEQLVNRKLLAQEAARRGLSVTDDELVTYMRDNFGVKDVTPEQYQNWVNRVFATTVDRFEAIAREQILAEKLQDVVGQGVAVSDDELKRDYMREHDNASVTYVKFDADTGAAKPTDAEIDALLATGMQEIQERYDRDILKYRTPQETQVRQILKTVAPDASETDVAKARATLVDIKAQLDGGADFATIAREKSDDEASKANGGDLGWVGPGQLAKALQDSIAPLKKGEVTKEPVRTARGLHLLQVVDIKPPARKELEQVKREVAMSVLQERVAEGKAKGEAEAFLAKLKGGGKLEALTYTAEEARDAKEKPKAEQRPVRAETPSILKSQESIPRIGASKELHEAIFALTTEAPLAPQAFKVGRAYYVVTLKERETPDETKFASMRDSLRGQAESMKRTRVVKDWLDNLRKGAEVKLNPELFGDTSATPAADAEAEG